MPKRDLTGQQFGELTVLKYAGYIGSKTYWTCQCSCGTIKNIGTTALINGSIKSCGKHRASRYEDLSEQKFGKLTPIKYLGLQNNESFWLCQCDCGTQLTVRTRSLVRGYTKSCGCAQYTKKDHIGEVYGQWTIIADAGYKKGAHYVTCQCSCGTVKDIHYSTLRAGRTTSCGHNYNKLIDLTGEHFGDWTVISQAPTVHSTTYWNCQCTCGKTAVVSSQALRNGESTSCGHRTIIDLYNKTFGDWTVIGHTELIDGLQYCKCKCSCGVVRDVYIHNLISGKSISCGHSTSSSQPEQEIVNFITFLGYKPVQRDRLILNGKELDIYIPEAKLAIEYNGSYWHSVDAGKSKDYHITKTQLCTKIGINLIHIFEHEWQNTEKQNKLKEILKSRLNVGQKVIWARNTKVINITNAAIVRDFLDKYHLQGNTNFEIALGLVVDNELLEVMTFGKPRFNMSYEVELLRLCTKAGYKVVGGANKLYNHYIKHYQPSSLISYCDLSKFSGKVYKQLGLKQIDISAPNYVYVKCVHSVYTVKSRYQCQKQDLIAKGYGTPDQTETEIMSNLGYYKIYDCGNAVYSYIKT